MKGASQRTWRWEEVGGWVGRRGLGGRSLIEMGWVGGWVGGRGSITYGVVPGVDADALRLPVAALPVFPLWRGGWVGGWVGG